MCEICKKHLEDCWVFYFETEEMSVLAILLWESWVCGRGWINQARTFYFWKQDPRLLAGEMTIFKRQRRVHQEYCVRSTREMGGKWRECSVTELKRMCRVHEKRSSGSKVSEIKESDVWRMSFGFRNMHISLVPKHKLFPLLRMFFTPFGSFWTHSLLSRCFSSVPTSVMTSPRKIISLS